MPGATLLLLLQNTSITPTRSYPSLVAGVIAQRAESAVVDPSKTQIQDR